MVGLISESSSIGLKSGSEGLISKFAEDVASFAVEEKHTLYGKCKGPYQIQSEEGIESLISSMESIKGRMPRIQQSVIDSLETVISAKLKSIEAAGYGSAEIEAVEKVLKVLSEKQKKMRADLKQMPKCTLASKARYVAFEEQIKEIARNASKLSGFLGRGAFLH